MLLACHQAQGDAPDQHQQSAAQFETCELAIENLVADLVSDWEVARGKLIETLPQDISEYSICTVRSDSNPILKTGELYALLDPDDVTVFVMTSSHPSTLNFYGPFFSAYRK